MRSRSSGWMNEIQARGFSHSSMEWPNIATERMKWDVEYQRRIGLETRPAELDPQATREFTRLSKRIYRILGLSGYARIDYRLTDDQRIYVLEVNPNPYLETQCEVAMGARERGVSYEALVQRIVDTAARRHGLGVDVRATARAPAPEPAPAPH